MKILTLKNLTAVAFSLTLLNFAALNAQAEEATYDIVEVSFNVGSLDYENKREFDTSPFIGWGLGLQLTKNWRTLLNYSKLNRQKLTGSDELVIQKYQADGVYTFNPTGSWRPYIVGSYGELDTKKNGIRANTKQYTQYGIGLGLTYAISAKWFLHTEFHNYYSNSLSNPDVDTESKVMIAYRFGNGEK